MAESLYSVPIISTFIFWLIGLSSNWRRTIVTVLLSYAAMILAFQHFTRLADMIRDISSTSLSNNQSIALGFGIGLGISLLGLYVLYTTLWSPSTSSNEKDAGGNRLLQSIITAFIGWALGVLVATSYLHYSTETFSLTQMHGTTLLNLIEVTTKIIIKSVSPWLVHDPPNFLLESGIR